MKRFLDLVARGFSWRIGALLAALVFAGVVKAFR